MAEKKKPGLSTMEALVAVGEEIENVAEYVNADAGDRFWTWNDDRTVVSSEWKGLHLMVAQGPHAHQDAWEWKVKSGHGVVLAGGACTIADGGSVGARKHACEASIRIHIESLGPGVYGVVCDETTNSPEDVATGILRGRIHGLCVHGRLANGMCPHCIGVATDSLRVTCDETNNPPESVAKGDLNVTVEGPEEVLRSISGQERQEILDGGGSVVHVHHDTETGEETFLGVEHPTEIQLDQAVIDKATEEPWEVCVDTGDEGSGFGCWAVTPFCKEENAEQANHDAVFIFRARTRWPAALDEIMSLKEQVVNLMVEASTAVENEAGGKRELEYAKDTIRSLEKSIDHKHGAGGASHWEAYCQAAAKIEALKSKLEDLEGDIDGLTLERDALQTKAARLEKEVAEYARAQEEMS